MDVSAQAEFFDFPVIEEKAKRGVLRQYLALTREHGALVPLPMVAVAAGVSHQRISVLVDQGRLASVAIGDRRYVPAAALEFYLTEERKSGRPWPQPTRSALLKSALQK